jgi:hypothetical protein
MAKILAFPKINDAVAQTEKAVKELRQKEWDEEFGEHCECPVCGTACEMLFVEGK